MSDMGLLGWVTLVLKRYKIIFGCTWVDVLGLLSVDVFGMLSMFSEDWHDLGFEIRWFLRILGMICHPDPPTCFICSEIGMNWDPPIRVFCAIGMIWDSYPCFLTLICACTWVIVIHLLSEDCAWFGKLSMSSEDSHDSRFEIRWFLRILGMICHPDPPTCFICSEIGMNWDPPIRVFCAIGMIWDSYPCFLTLICACTWVIVIHLLSEDCAWFGKLSMSSEDSHDSRCYRWFLRIRMILRFEITRFDDSRHDLPILQKSGFFHASSASEIGENTIPQNPCFCAIGVSSTICSR